MVLSIALLAAQNPAESAGEQARPGAPSNHASTPQADSDAPAKTKGDDSILQLVGRASIIAAASGVSSAAIVLGVPTIFALMVVGATYLSEVSDAQRLIFTVGSPFMYSLPIFVLGVVAIAVACFTEITLGEMFLSTIGGAIAGALSMLLGMVLGPPIALTLYVQTGMAANNNVGTATGVFILGLLAGAGIGTVAGGMLGATSTYVFLNTPIHAIEDAE